MLRLAGLGAALPSWARWKVRHGGSSREQEGPPRPTTSPRRSGDSLLEHLVETCLSPWPALSPSAQGDPEKKSWGEPRSVRSKPRLTTLLLLEMVSPGHLKTEEQELTRLGFWTESPLRVPRFLPQTQFLNTDNRGQPPRSRPTETVPRRSAGGRAPLWCGTPGFD